MSQAIDAVPTGLGISTAAAVVTAALWAAGSRAPSPPPPVHEVLPVHPARVELPVMQTQHMDRCAGARGIVIAGRVTGDPGPTHVRLAGPILYSDVMTDRDGRFELRIPIDATSRDLCDLLPQTLTFRFADRATTLEYDISLER